MHDLSTYSLSKLRALEVQVIDELKTRHYLSVSKAREQILHIAQSAGISVKDLMSGKSAPQAGRTSPQKVPLLIEAGAAVSEWE